MDCDATQNDTNLGAEESQETYLGKIAPGIKSNHISDF